MAKSSRAARPLVRDRSATERPAKSRLRAAAAAAAMEMLEPRRLLTVSYSGVVYYDLDGNGDRDPEEPGVPGVLVHVIGQGSDSQTSNIEFDEEDTSGSGGSYQIHVPDVDVAGCGTIFVEPDPQYVTTSPTFFSLSLYENGGGDINFGLEPAKPPDVPEDPCHCHKPIGAELPAKENVSPGPVRYGDGLVEEQAIDLASASTLPWGHSRSWTNSDLYARRGQNGNGWVVEQWPTLFKYSNSIAEITDGNDAQWFDGTSSFAARHGSLDTLTLADGEYVLTQADGSQFRFYDFDESLPFWQRGAFESYRDAGGNEVAAYAHNVKGDITEIRQTARDTRAVDAYVYEYYASGANVGRLYRVTYKVSADAGSTFDTVRTAEYDYYDGSGSGAQAYGTLGDLRRVVIRDADGTALDTSYYRYYVAGESGGYAGAMKLALYATDYARAAAGLGDPLTATDTALKAYASRYYEYDGAHRIAAETVSAAGCSSCGGGFGTYGFSYATSTNADDYNSWKYKTTETLPDGNQNVVYMNYLQQVMLKVFKETSTARQWPEYYQYDSSGRLVMEAGPSAVASYWSTSADLLTDPDVPAAVLGGLRPHGGLIDVWEYWNTTSNGGAPGRLKTHSVKRGEDDGFPTKVEFWAYVAHAVGGVTLYVPGTHVLYRDDDESEAPALYEYAYTWYAGTNQPSSITTTLPAIAADHNGAGTAFDETTFYDTYGRAVWEKDAEGYVTYFEYDPTTGQPTRQVVDADTRYATNVLDDQPLGYWRFGESSGTAAADGSGHGRMGTNSGTLTLGATGGLAGGDANTAYGLGGAGQVDLGAPTVVRRTAFTIEAWIKTTANTGSLDVFADGGGAASDYVKFQLQGTTGKMLLVYRGDAGVVSTLSSTSAGYNDGAWHHVVLTVSGGNVTFYKDGVVDGTGTFLGNPQTDTDSASVIGATWLGDDRFSGTLDEVAVYDRELSAVRVANHYAVGRGVIAGAVGSRSGLHLSTAVTFDALGRPTKVTDPGGNVSYSVYNDPNHEVRTYAGWRQVGGNWGPTGPVLVSRDDRPGSYNETLTFVYSPGTNATPTGLEDITASNLRSMVRKFQNNASQLDHTDNYFSMSGLTSYTTDPAFGVAGTNFYRTSYGYDRRGRLSRVENAVGTISRTFYDGLGRVVSTWVGTNDERANTGASWSPSNQGTNANMVQLVENLYDTYNVYEPVSGDSNLTRATWDPAGPAPRVVEYYYDWRDRVVATKSGLAMNGSFVADPAAEDTTTHRPITYYTYDNQDQIVRVDQYDGDQVAMTGTNNAAIDLDADGVPDAPSAGRLRARTTVDYDEQFRPYRTQVFNVSQSGTAAGSVAGKTLKTWNWYDKRGLLIKTQAPGGLATKYAYDGAGRVTAEYLTDAGGDAPYAATNGGSWWNARDVVGDHVLEQRETQYDPNGNPIFATTRLHFHDDANTGALADASGTPKARVSFQAFYYDAADRPTDAVDVGTNGGAAYTRPGTAPTNRSNTLLITHYDYDDAGLPATTTDPRGIASKSYYDLLGRTTKTIANYVDGTPDAADDQTTLFTYDGVDNVLTMTADLPSGQHDQTTQYVYGVAAGGNNAVTSNDLLREVRYPDKATGLAGTNAANLEAFAYDALGETTSKTDRNGSAHVYGYDVLGRLASDTVTTLGTGVAGDVRRLDFSYDGAGLPYQLTSYSSTSGGSLNVLNQVQRAYNGYGQLTAEWQEHDGLVSTGTTPGVQYRYSEGGTDEHDDHSRLTSVVYPNGRVLRYEYGPAQGLDDRISRLAFLADQANGAASTHIEEYEYLGLSTPVIRNRPAANSKLTYVRDAGDTLVGDAGDRYTGLDRFGRVVDQRWVGQSGSNVTTLDRFKYGYDADSNPLFKENAVDPTKSELYHSNGASAGYDGLNRLTDFRRGTLSDANADGAPDTVATLSGLAGSQKSWDLDAVGNWDSSTTDGTATSRTHDDQNAVTAVGGAGLTYDDDGNTVVDETGKHFAYDAWNRLVQVSVGGSAVQSYAYDAAGRRITEDAGTAKDLYYSDQWQVLEERDAGLPAEQYVWSPTYVDELIERDRDADQDLDGTLDTSFSSDGKQVVDFNSGSNDIASDVLIQPDGKTVVVGHAGPDIAVLRLNADGSPDTTFGSGGKVTTDFNGFIDVGTAVALDAAGNILVAGYTGVSGGGSRFAVVRYLPDGTLDSTFGSGGKVTTTFTGSNIDRAASLAVQADGRIVVVGYVGDHDDEFPAYALAIARYLPDGSPDTSFNGTGTLTYSPGGSTNIEAVDVALDADGNLFVAASDGATYFVRKYAPDGSLNASFGTGGVAQLTVGTNSSPASDLALQADGKILVLGGTATGIALVRFNADGTLDTSFDGDGKRTASAGAGTERGLRLQADGKIVVATYLGSSFWVARFNPDGSFDTSFDGDGKLTTDVGPGLDAATALTIGPDYRITVAGIAGSTFLIPGDFGVVRYKVSGSLEERLYAQTDANHNVTSVSDTFGNVKERFVYDPYGASTVLTPGGGATTDSLDWVYRHQGGRLDAVTAFYNFGNRDYSAALGRWLQQDPAGYVDGASLYQYLRSIPLAGVDPSGLGFWSSFGSALYDAGATVASGTYHFAANVVAGTGEVLIPGGYNPGPAQGYAGVAGRVVGRAVGGVVAVGETAGGVAVAGAAVAAEGPSFGTSTVIVVASAAVAAHGIVSLGNVSKPIAMNMSGSGSGSSSGSTSPSNSPGSSPAGTPCPTRGMGGRVLTPAEQAEFDSFAGRAKKLGLVENPNRTGSWGKIGPNGKYEEVTRVDVGEAGKPGWRENTHMHLAGQPDEHLPLTTPIPGE